MTLNLTYGSLYYLKVVNVDYDDVAHTIINGSVGSTTIPSGIGEGVEFYRQTGVGEYWALKAQNASPFAYVEHVTLALAEDLSIDSVAITKQIGVTLGSIIVTVSGTGTKRYTLGATGPQASNVFSNLYAGTYLLTLSRTEDGYTVSQSIVVELVPDLEISATVTDCTANGIDNGTLTLNVLNGSGDYDADFVTESVVVPLTAADPTEVRTGLAPNDYTVTVTDNITGQTRTIVLTIVYPAVVVPDIAGTVFEVPFVNSITFVVPDNNDQQLDNVLFADQVHPGYDETCYFQPFNQEDTPRVQFRSNYLTHKMRLYKTVDDSLVKEFPIELTEENVGSTIDFAIIIKDYELPNQSKVYFQSGTIPVPLAIGNTFEVSNNADGFNGLYTIIDKLIEASTGLPILVINLDYTAGGPTSTATGTFDNQLADYNVFESVITLDDVVAGKYYLRIDASDPSDKYAVSEPIEVKTSHSGTLAIIYSNTDNDFGMVFSTGFRGFVRVHASMFKRLTGGERTVTRNSNDSLVKIRARKRRIVEFETDLIPPYLHEKLSCIFDTDYFSINGQAFQASEGYDEPQYTERSRLSLSKIKLEQLNWFGVFKSNKDMPTESESCVCDTLDLVSVSTSASTINLNLYNKVARIFRLNGNIAGPKTLALLNDTLGLSIKLIIDISNVAGVLTFPSTFKMSTSDPRWDDGAKTFTPASVGTYEGEAIYDGTYWRLSLNN